VVSLALKVWIGEWVVWQTKLRVANRLEASRLALGPRGGGEMVVSFREAHAENSRASSA
jgi:hypothetical protein